MALIIDTGPLYSTLDATDADHPACAQLLESAREPRVIPAPVLVELDYLCSRTASGKAFALVLEQIQRRALRVEDVTDADYRRIDALLRTYADLGVGFVDAAVLAIVERLGEPKLATLDHRHFAVMRPRHVDALELLPARS